MQHSLTRIAVLAAACLLVALASVAADADAQRRTPRRRVPAARPLQTEAAKLKCPEPLGTGARTGAQFCFVLATNDPAKGIIVPIPPHTGPATLLFDLHNRHTYSEEDVRAGRGYARYLAVIGIINMKGELLSKAAVQSEFRNAADLYDRITGGAGPGGLKAVAPIGREQIVVTIPAGLDEVSLIGGVLDATTAAGREIATPGRTVAIVSNVRLEYRPRAR